MSQSEAPQKLAEEKIQEALAYRSTVLNLSGLGLSQLPESIGQLTLLQSLSVANNQLTTLPESVGQLALLQWLEVQGNQLTTLPESVGQLALLQKLSVHTNQLTTLPESVGQLALLRLFYVGNNQLTTLPKSIGQLAHLQTLSVHRNQLTTLPKSIGQLAHLQALYVDNNQLTMLPETVGQLAYLQTLDVDNNQLTTLPESLRKIESLRELYLHGNEKLRLPPEVLGPTWEQVRYQGKSPAKPAEILDYYFRTRGGARPLNEAKLILVGRGNVGKTSLLKRLLFGTFDKGEQKTEGIRIEAWNLRLKRKEQVKLHVWDFGGQEIQHATHQFFLTQRSVYLLVLNGRDGLEAADAEYWLKLIESLGAESPVIVVLNKINEHPFDLNRRGLQQKFPAIREFVRTDCADRTGIQELRAAIERETDRLEHLRASFPKSWFAIKDRLAGMKENYLPFEQYQAICTKLGEPDHEAQEFLASHLHRLGIALNYSDDPRLRDKHILNPHWVTSGIYTILNAPKLEQQKGELCVADLPAILDRANYPRSMDTFLFDLMKKFELCFPIPDEQDRYLIPALLAVEEPKETAEFPAEACLNFQYHYPILPEGLISRFIVRTRVLSEGLLRWRTGVILKFEDQCALVKADVQAGKVFISVSGPVAGRRRLLAIIRSDFERIHASLEKLNPEAMVPVSDCPGLLESYEELEVREKNGALDFTRVFNKNVINLNAKELLNGVDLEGTRRGTMTTEKEGGALRLFYSYAHKDERLRDKLETHLKLLQRNGQIATWHDRKISAGNEWERKIDDNLKTADIILLLVSADFIASNYCYDEEMKLALERHDEGKARVIPVILRDVDWTQAPFAKLQALPKDGRAVMTWPNKDSAWRNVAEGIARVVEEMRPTRRGGG